MSFAVHVASGTADVQGYPNSTALYGVTLTAAAATVVTLRNGTLVTDPVVAIARLTAAGAVHVPVPGASCPNGVFVDRDGVASELVLYVS